MTTLPHLALALWSLGSGSSGTDVRGDIDRDTTWTVSGSPYCLSDDATVLSGVTLTVDPGVEVQIPDATHALLIQGRVDAIGTPANPIRFSGAASGLGGSIVFDDGSSGLIEECDFETLGADRSAGAAITILGDDARPAVADCRFSNNDRDVLGHEGAFHHFGANAAIYVVRDGDVPGTFIWPAGRYTVLEDVIVDQDASLRIEDGVRLDLYDRDHELRVEGALAMAGNASTGILVTGLRQARPGSGVVIEPSATDIDIQHVAFENLGRGSAGAALAVLKPTSTDPVVQHCTFDGNIKDVLAHEAAFGQFAENGGAYWISDEVVTTSYRWPAGLYRPARDVTVDVGATLTIEPGVRLLLSLTFNDLIVEGSLEVSGTQDDPVTFDGFSDGATIVLQPGARSTFEYAEFLELGAGGYGCALYDESGDTTLTDCLFVRNLQDAYRVQAGSPRLRRTHFIQQPGYAIVNVGNGTVDAKNCWWGAPDGPNPPGSGGRLDGAVDFTPFEPSPTYFQLDVEPPVTPPGYGVLLTMRVSNPGSLVALFAVGVDGIPIAPIQLGLGRSDSSGEWYAGGQAPPGMMDLTLELQAFTIDPIAFVVRTATAQLTIEP